MFDISKSFKKIKKFFKKGIDKGGEI